MSRNAPPPAPGRYRWYVLAVLTASLAFSLVDRQILTILAGPIKADLGLSDAEIGLLYGTTFAVFYSLFGIPLGRVSDVWLRGKLMALGLFGWSLMTIFSGFAVNLTQLAAARMGVGVGEASANSASYSLISDYFPKRSAPPRSRSILGRLLRPRRLAVDRRRHRPICGRAGSAPARRRSASRRGRPPSSSSAPPVCSSRSSSGSSASRRAAPSTACRSSNWPAPGRPSCPSFSPSCRR
ncbi:MAG: MFS transporter [Rhizomicrobium sp.]